MEYLFYRDDERSPLRWIFDLSISLSPVSRGWDRSIVPTQCRGMVSLLRSVFNFLIFIYESKTAFYG